MRNPEMTSTSIEYMPELANEVVSCPLDYIPASMVRNPIGNNIELIKATVGSSDPPTLHKGKLHLPQ